MENKVRVMATGRRTIEQPRVCDELHHSRQSAHQKLGRERHWRKALFPAPVIVLGRAEFAAQRAGYLRARHMGKGRADKHGDKSLFL